MESLRKKIEFCSKNHRNSDDSEDLFRLEEIEMERMKRKRERRRREVQKREMVPERDIETDFDRIRRSKFTEGNKTEKAQVEKKEISEESEREDRRRNRRLSNEFSETKKNESIDGKVIQLSSKSRSNDAHLLFSDEKPEKIDEKEKSFFSEKNKIEEQKVEDKKLLNLAEEKRKSFAQMSIKSKAQIVVSQSLSF